MVTVIIPALNEEQTIAEVVKFCFREPLVNEVIVVDDQSDDETRERAKAAGATVLLSKIRGKGISMKEGILSATNKLLVFLDADIHPYPSDTIRNLIQPLLDNEFDFVKAAFARNAGRVTELMAKPLLKIFYPELHSFKQPLGGMIAGKKCFLDKIDFFHDYGVDIGILIDMFLMQVRIKEVNIGYIENKSKPWQMLSKMSSEVARAIIKRATQHQFHMSGLDDTNSMKNVRGQLKSSKNGKSDVMRKMVVFDMDNTLLQGRFIDTCARKFSFTGELEKLRMIEKDPAVLTKRIAKMLKGLSLGELLEVAASIPVIADAVDIVEKLRKQGNIVGIISDSYQFVTDYLKNKLNADFALGNQLEFFEGKATGEVTIPSSFFYHPESKCNHSLCKTNALVHIANMYSISIENCIAIGDSENDVCMVEHSGTGIAFCTQNMQLRNVANLAIDNLSFKKLLHVIRWPYQRVNKNTSLLE